MKSLTSGDIIYFVDREGYRNSRPENIGAHVQFPDYMVIDSKRWGLGDDETFYTAVGVKRVAPLIMESELKFFNFVGRLEDTKYPVDKIKKDPHYFSRLYASGQFCEIPIFMKSTLTALSNYHPHLEENKKRITEITEKREETGTLLPTEMMELTLHMMRGTYLGLLKAYKGNVNEATKGLMNIMVQTSRSMTKTLI